MMLSIVTTLYNSGAHVEEFHRRMSAQALQVADDYEIVMVDDGSTDDSLQTAISIAAVDPHVRVVELSRNFGHHKAIMTGLDLAKGSLIFLIDSDLEEDPALLPVFWRTLMERGVDVVYGYQETRRGPLLERLGGALHWWLIRHLATYPIPTNLVTVRLMTRQYVRSLVLHRERNTAIGGLWAITGYRQLGMGVAKDERRTTTYSLSKRVGMAFDGITAFSMKPLMIVFTSGLVIFVMSVLGAIYLVVQRLTGHVMPGWTSVLVSVWMLGGLAVASIGVLGLYIGRIFIETKQRPYSIIRRIYGALENESNDGHSGSIGR